MAKAYLILNAVLYAGLAVLCTLRFRQTSQGSGLLTLSPPGNSEYLVIYGGLQLGLAAFYAFLSFRPEFFRVGLIFSILLYAPIVLWWVSSIHRINSTDRHPPGDCRRTSAAAIQRFRRLRI